MTQDQLGAAHGDSVNESDFEVTMRGYNKRQVDDYVSWLQNEVRSAQESAVALQRQVESHRQDVQRAQDELAELRREAVAARPAHEEVSERLGQILRLADEEADQKRARAVTEAESTLEASREQASKVLDAARSAAEGIISAARERAEKEAANAKAEAESLLAHATASSTATLHDAEQRAAYVLADADRRTAAITALQDERLAALRDVHTDTLRRLEGVRGVLETVLTAEADAGPPDNGVAPVALPQAGLAVRPADAVLPSAAVMAAPVVVEHELPAPVVDPLLSPEYVDGILAEESSGDQEPVEVYHQTLDADGAVDDQTLSIRR